jgi:hypothetical protein
MRRGVCATDLLVRPWAAVRAAVGAFLALWVLVRGPATYVIKHPRAIRRSAYRGVVRESIHNNFLPLEGSHWRVRDGMHNQGICAPRIQAATVRHLRSEHVVLLIIAQRNRTTPTRGAVENGRWRVCRCGRRGGDVQEGAVITKPWKVTNARTLITNTIQIAIFIHSAISGRGAQQ